MASPLVRLFLIASEPSESMASLPARPNFDSVFSNSAFNLAISNREAST